MLAEDRLQRIVAMVQQQGSVTVGELAQALEISESTIRRDLEKLDQAHLLSKVHGGATSLEKAHVTRDLTLSERYGLHADEKHAIAAYAASLVSADDYVYIDAGSTTEDLIGCLTEKGATYVTDSVSHAMKLAAKGMRVVVLGGELKDATEALVGPEALGTLSTMNFTIGFWGANGISAERGLTTPDRNEGEVKRVSMRRCERRYVLADASKFDRVAPVSFAALADVCVLTNQVPEAYRAWSNVVEVAK